MAVKIRQEINILDAILSAAGGSSGTSNEIVQLDTTQYVNPTFYFEIVGDSSVSISFNVTLRRSGTSTDDATCNIPLLTTAYKRVRSSSFTPPTGQTEYVVFIDATAGATKNVKSARIIIIDNPTILISSETQIEIGANEAAKTNTAIAALTDPKYWLYTAANWDGVKTFYAEVVSKTSAANTHTVRLEEDDGSFANWTTKVTIVSAVTGTTVTRRRSVAFTPTDGRHYRITALCSTTKSNYTIYNGKIIVDQVGSGGGLSVGTPTLDATSTSGISGASNPSPVTLAHTVGPQANMALIMAFSCRGNAAVSSATYNGVALTKLKAIPNGTDERTEIWGLLNPASGTHDLVVSYSPSQVVVVTAASYYNITGFRNSNSNTGNAVTSSSVTNTNAVTDMIVDTIGLQTGNVTPAVGSGQTLRQSGNTVNMGFGYADKLVPSANNTMSWTFTSNIYAAVAVVLTSEYITKLEAQYLLLNSADAGTGEQDMDTLWDSTEWSNVTNTYKYAHDATNAADASKLRDTTAAADVSGATVTGANQQISSAFTMPTTGDTLDTNVTVSTGVVGAVRILVAVSTVVITHTPDFFNFFPLGR